MLSKRLSGALVCALTGLAASAASAADFPISGNARFQYGNDLPVPITFTSLPSGPNGAIQATPSAVVQQTTGPDPKQIQLAPGKLTAGPTQMIVPIFLANPSVFQLESSLAVSFPRAAATFQAGGRTGPATATFCAGQALGTPMAPICTGPADSNSTVHGLIRYTKTANQFGGPAQFGIAGTRGAALRALGGAPCTVASGSCVVAYASTAPPSTPAIGGPFGTATRINPAPSPGIHFASVGYMGTVLSITPTGLGPGLPNGISSAGGPWTTGMLTVSVTANLGGPPQIFMLSGSDNRVAGVGTISLVSGGVSDTVLSGPTANRGWLNLTVMPEPSRWLLLAAGLSLVIALTLRARRPAGRS